MCDPLLRSATRRAALKIATSSVVLPLWREVLVRAAVQHSPYALHASNTTLDINHRALEDRPWPGARMQDVDRPTQIQALAEPASARRPRVDTKALRVVRRQENLDGITEHCSRRRHLRQRAAIRPPELERPVG